MANFDKFYKDISSRCGFMDVKSVSDFYLAMVKNILDGLRHDGVAHLPSFGKFVIVKYKGKSWSLNGGGYVPPTKNIKFIPSEKLRVFSKTKT